MGSVMWIPSSLRGAVPREEVPQALFWQMWPFSRQHALTCCQRAPEGVHGLVNVVACHCLCCSRSDVVRAWPWVITVGDAKNFKIVVFS